VVVRFPRERATPETKKQYKQRINRAEVTHPRLGHVHEEEVPHKGEQVELEPKIGLWGRLREWVLLRFGID